MTPRAWFWLALLLSLLVLHAVFAAPSTAVLSVDGTT